MSTSPPPSNADNTYTCCKCPSGKVLAQPLHSFDFQEFQCTCRHDFCDSCHMFSFYNPKPDVHIVRYYKGETLVRLEITRFNEDKTIFRNLGKTFDPVDQEGMMCWKSDLDVTERFLLPIGNPETGTYTRERSKVSNYGLDSQQARAAIQPSETRQAKFAPWKVEQLGEERYKIGWPDTSDMEFCVG